MPVKKAIPFNVGISNSLFAFVIATYTSLVLICCSKDLISTASTVARTPFSFKIRSTFDATVWLVATPDPHATITFFHCNHSPNCFFRKSHKVLLSFIVFICSTKSASINFSMILESSGT